MDQKKKKNPEILKPTSVWSIRLLLNQIQTTPWWLTVERDSFLSNTLWPLIQTNATWFITKTIKLSRTEKHNTSFYQAGNKTPSMAIWVEAEMEKTIIGRKCLCFRQNVFKCFPDLQRPLLLVSFPFQMPQFLFYLVLYAPASLSCIWFIGSNLYSHGLITWHLVVL